MSSVPPGLISAPRLTTLFAALMVSLASGTNYVYSAYSPQLGSRLHITHTQLNIIALAGNMGVYVTGPLWGKIADSRGPRYLLPSAFILLLIGYAGIRQSYISGTTWTSAVVYVLALCSFMTGAGGSAGLAAAINTTAKTFPDNARATSTGIVISGFGLSAFAFSIIAHTAFAGNVASFLLLLCLGTSLPMIIAFFFLRIVPLPTPGRSSGLEDGTEAVDTDGDRSEAPLLMHADLQEDQPAPPFVEQESEYHIPQNRDSLELSPVRTRSPSRSARRHSPSAHPEGNSFPAKLSPDLHGISLWTSGDFWLLCAILSLLAGTGLMYINNVGSMSIALAVKDDPSFDKDVAAKWQAAQVSTLSIMNFCGRIAIGLTSDFTKNFLGFPRSYCLSLVAILFIASQILAASIQDITELWKATALVGLAYGSVFGIFPTMVIEWFGLSHFSENWGYVCLSPMPGSNILSLAFGMNLDSHSRPKNGTTTSLPSEPSTDQCLQGRLCYVDSLYITIAVCFVALLLSIWAGWKDRKKLEVPGLRETPSDAVLIWEGPEEQS